jgi:hypothetical protein
MEKKPITENAMVYQSRKTLRARISKGERRLIIQTSMK